MLLRLALSLLLLGTASVAQAQQPPAPQVTRHGNWVSGRISGQGREGCISGTAVPQRGLLQVTIGREASGLVVLVLAVRIEGASLPETGTVRFRVDGRNFEARGQAPQANAPLVAVVAGTEEEARTLSDLLVAMRAGRELRIEAGSSNLTLPLTGAGAALAAMRTCAQRAGMMAAPPPATAPAR